MINSSVRVIGVGLQKTGTSSLGRAIQALGWNTTQHASPAKYDCFIRGSWTAGCDFPFFVKYKELYDQFPDAKFIATVRDDESWLRSMEYEVERVKTTSAWNSDWAIRYRQEFYGTLDFDRDAFLEIKHRHYNEVYEFFSDKELLTMNIIDGDGWEPLCEYLNVDIPQKRFPHENKMKS